MKRNRETRGIQMKQVEVLRYDAFSKEPNKGNPAGVVLEGSRLTDEEMQLIAKKAGYNETSFLLPSKSADLRLRYFTPGHEMNLCGHATVASLYALYEKGGIGPGAELKVETKAGNLTVKTGYADEESIFLLRWSRRRRAFVRLRETGPSWLKHSASLKRTSTIRCPSFTEAPGLGRCWCLFNIWRHAGRCSRKIPNSQPF